jgi:ribonuclease G
MSKELIVSANRHETRVAIVEEEQVVEVYHQRENEYSLAGSIHKGRVTRVLPGMQSAFVDIGLDRDAFLYVSDFFEDNEEYDKIVTSVEEKVLKLDRTPAAIVIATPAAEPAAEEPVAPPESQETGEPAPAAAAPSAAPAGGPAATSAGPGGMPQDRRRDDDRRGRRGRRRGRGGPKERGGRGLPESKFYSPGARGPEPARQEEPAAEPAAAAPAAAATSAEGDDFFVLPGESLAKYRGGEDPQDFSETESEMVSEIAAEPSEEPQPELAEVAAEVEDAIVEAAEESDEEPMEEPVQTAREETPQHPVERHAAAQAEEPQGAAQPAEAAVDILPVPADAAEPEEETFETSDAEASMEDGAEEAGVEAGDLEGQPNAEEGPEPARIPTSLTATLREQGQGPRYLQHRVSRRMRRRGGRDGREGGREGRPPQQEGGGRPPHPEARTTERPPDQRTVQAPRPEPRDKGAAPSISDLLREGQEIIVQIAKEPLGQKGARITSHIALPGRFLVYMPTVDHIGVSRKIPSDDERARLKRILQSNRTGIPGGYIVRTAGDGRSEEELRADMMFLYNLWLDMRQKAERRPAPMLIHHDLNVVERVLRDQLTSAFKSIWVDNEEVYESVLRFVQRFQPALVNRVKMYTRSTPIFDEFGITAELEKALRPKVWLKSGGYIVINQTEALVAIDVNTGKFVGKSNRLEDTIVRTNTDAIKEIVRQIRLRDLGGIIVVDFIDMDERKNRQKVMQALEDAMRSDRAPYKILQFNDFGLVAITRKRVKQSLERTLCTPCPYCEGAGYVKSPATVVGEILQEAQKIAKVVEGKDVMLRVSPEVAKLLKSNQNSYLQEIEEILGRTVIVKSDHQLHQEKFDLA